MSEEETLRVLDAYKDMCLSDTNVRKKIAQAIELDRSSRLCELCQEKADKATGTFTVCVACAERLNRTAKTRSAYTLNEYKLTHTGEVVAIRSIPMHFEQIKDVFKRRLLQGTWKRRKDG